MEKRKVRILILGRFSEIFMNILKVAAPDFEISKILPQDYSIDTFFNFIQDEFQPQIICIHPEDYLASPAFFDELRDEKFPKICFYMFQKMKLNLWKKFSEEGVSLMKKEMEGIISRVEKNK